MSVVFNRRNFECCCVTSSSGHRRGKILKASRDPVVRLKARNTFVARLAGALVRDRGPGAWFLGQAPSGSTLAGPANGLRQQGLCCCRPSQKFSAARPARSWWVAASAFCLALQPLSPGPCPMHSVTPISRVSASSPASRSSEDGGGSQDNGTRIQAQSSQGPSSQPDVFEHVPASTLPEPGHDPRQLSVNFANRGLGDLDSIGAQESAFHLHLVWKQPWQTGLLQQQPGAKRLRPKGPLPLVQLEQAPVEGSYGSEQPRSEGLEAVCAKLAKCKHDSWEQMQSEERNLAVNKWVRIVATSPMSFQVARDFFASKASGLTTVNLAASVSDALSVKATSTVHSRANSIIRFVSWAKSASVQAFPATEGVVYHYFEQLKDSAAPTTFRSFLSALGFAKHVFGLLEAEKVYFSGRVKGLADKLYCAKARLRQRSPLRVSDVERLEQICMGTIARSAPDGGRRLFPLPCLRPCKVLGWAKGVLFVPCVRVRQIRSKTSYTL